MKKLSIFVFLVCILLPGLSGCTTSRRVSVRERMLNAAWQQKETKKDKVIRSLEQTLNSWVGRHISRGIQRLGPATQITGDEAGGRIYIWTEHSQKTTHKPYVTMKTQQSAPTPSIAITEEPRETTTRGTMRWNSLFKWWEYEYETKPTHRIPNISRTIMEADNSVQRLQPQLRLEKEVITTTRHIMFYTRSDGTIYHWLVITPSNNHYAYNGEKNAKDDAHDYKNRRLTKEEKSQYLDKIRKYNVTISLFPGDANAYFNRGIVKYKLGLTSEGKLDLRTALRLATQQGKVKLKNTIEETLRNLQ